MQLFWWHATHRCLRKSNRLLSAEHRRGDNLRNKHRFPERIPQEIPCIERQRHLLKPPPWSLCLLSHKDSLTRKNFSQEILSREKMFKDVKAARSGRAAFTSSFSKERPDIIFREWREQRDRFFRNRVRELHLSAEQRDRTIGIAPWSAIFQIATNRASHLRQLTANLMMPACMQPNL